jgi:rhodanese-related sulfurtransferase
MKKLILLSLSLLLFMTSACDSATSSSSKTSAGAASLYTNINNTELAKLLEDKVTLVDIRRPEEWQQTGVVPGSNMITLFTSRGGVNPDFVSQLQKVSSPDKAVILICRTGNRTRAGSTMLVKQLGYKNVYNVTRGITGWIGDKREVSRL